LIGSGGKPQGDAAAICAYRGARKPALIWVKKK
jgi:hypothetical protein